MTSRDRIELLLLAVIWGASFLFMRVAAPEFGPIALVGIRVGVAALFLVVVLAWRGGLRGMLAESRPLTVLGAISSALPFTLFAYATLYVTAGVAAVLNATAPLFGALVGYFWLRDRLAPARCCCPCVQCTGHPSCRRCAAGSASSVWESSAPASPTSSFSG